MRGFRLDFGVDQGDHADADPAGIERLNPGRDAEQGEYKQHDDNITTK